MQSAGRDEHANRHVDLWRAGLCQAGVAGITNTMFWNEIRNHIRERLPAIVDFILFGMALTMIAVVLLGLSWLYVEYGMVIFLVGVVSVCFLGLLSGRRAPVYLAEDDFRLWDDKPMLPSPGKQALPPPGPPQIGRSNQALTKHRPALPKRGPN
jgi:hypothetical protein